MIKTFLHIILISLLTHICVYAQSQKDAKQYTYAVVNTFPHSTSSYTQGLQYVGSQMWESTGLNGASRLMKVDLHSGEQEVIKHLPKDEFGEGITHFGDSIFMITWQSNRAYIFSAKSGEVIDTKSYYGEGWGITTDGNRLYMSNGGYKIAIRDPKTFHLEREITVTLNGTPINYLNELEWIEGRIWANIYTFDKIVIINPQTGVVEGVINMEGLLPVEDRTPQTDVLNGIAYCPREKRVFVTGKNWSKLFEIEIIEI